MEFRTRLTDVGERIAQFETTSAKSAKLRFNLGKCAFIVFRQP